MKLRTLLFLLFAVSGAYAQTPIYQVSLQEQKLVVANPTFHIAEVLDLRPQQQTIGWVQRGMGNIRVPANLSGGVREGLGGWMQVQLPARPGSRPVLMRVHALRIGEHTKATSEKATADVDIDFVYQQPDGNYYVVQRYIEQEESKGLETTGRHDDNIVACLQRACTQLNVLDWAPRLSLAAPLTSEQVRYRGGRKPAAYDYPILTAAARPRGVYHTFLDFRNNKPTEAANLVVEKTTSANRPVADEVEAYLTTATGREPLRDVWGFSDGEQLYVLRQKRFYPLKRAGNDFTYVSWAAADPGAMSTAAVVGGLAGAAIAAATTQGNQQEYTLDMATGRVADFDYFDLLAQRDTALVVVYRRPGGSKAPLTVLLNGQELKTLPTNDFVLIPWTDKTRELNLCLQNAESGCYSFIPMFGTTTYVELKARAEGDTPALEYVPVKEGEYYVKKMRRR
ncbi:hypothetical protein LGH70_08780 [Hymenobacter sp. BT635]|uniref:Uncharacterized protein n=1 Tax=Hymenobacter nitidus TaxID=2880929 RepID=A0ABS8AB89_9BACT|nr:hypothetical protein [Hymenobacter nitidus]MCB2377673.1 hypothetical protein [Hymenobacter nitidus]